MSEPYRIFLLGNTWTVCVGDRRDPDLTEAFRAGFRRLSPQSIQRIKGLCEYFLNYRMKADEPLGAFVTEDRDAGFERIESMLEEWGFECTLSMREDGATEVHKGTGTSFNVLPSFIQTLDVVYASLHRQGLHEVGRPTKVVGFQKLTPSEINELRRILYGSVKKGASYNGSQFVTVGRKSSPVRFEDPRGLGARMRAAAVADGWKRSVYDLLCTLDDDGCRFEDAHALNAHDWSRWDFGNKIAAPNKGSKGERVKTIVVSTETALQLALSFENDPSRPSLAEMKQMVEDGDEEGLRAIPLFPSERGKPYSYHTVNNDYVRPTMTRHGVTIRSKFSTVRATLHRLRAGKIQAQLEVILFDLAIDEDQRWRMVDELRQDMSIKSKKSFYRYCGELVDMIAAESKARRAERRREESSNHGALRRPINGFQGFPNSTDDRLASLR